MMPSCGDSPRQRSAERPFMKRVSRLRNSLPFSRRGIPAGGVAPPSHMANIARSSRLASRAPRLENSATNFGGATLAVKFATVFVLLASLSGCGYSLAGRGSSLPSYVRSIGVPLFINSTPLFDLEQVLTQRVRLEFIGRGTYQVVPDSTGTDVVLTGEITSVALQPTAFNEQQQAARYAITVVIKVEMKDLKQNKTLYENPGLTFRDEYEVT